MWCAKYVGIKHGGAKREGGEGGIKSTTLMHEKDKFIITTRLIVVTYITMHFSLFTLFLILFHLLLL